MCQPKGSHGHEKRENGGEASDDLLLRVLHVLLLLRCVRLLLRRVALLLGVATLLRRVLRLLLGCAIVLRRLRLRLSVMP